MMLIKRRLQAILFASAAVLAVHAAAQPMGEDNEHVKRWNAFADGVLKLHRQLVAEHEVEVKERVGGYFRQPEFYVEKRYIHAPTGNLISVVQRETQDPNPLHAIEVFIRDDQGRVVRDYTVAFLPGYHNAPTQALVSFHNYNGDLHAFRSFDASGYRVVERCLGTYKGEDVNFILDEGQIADALNGVTDIMQSDKYQACFEGLPEEGGEYLTPP